MMSRYAKLFLTTYSLLTAMSLFAGGIIHGPPGPETVIFVPAACDPTRPVPIPYAESFEGWTDYTPIGEITNWVVLDGDASVIRRVDYSYDAAHPLETNHTLVANLETEGQTLLCSVTGAATHVWADLMVRCFPSEEDPWFENDFGLALFANVTSNLVAYGRTAGSTNYEAISSSLGIDPDRWYRLTVHLAYLDNPDDGFFSVSVDQCQLSWPGGETLPGVPSASGSGPWLRFAYKPATRVFPGLAFRGIGWIDDLVIDTRYREPANSVTADLAPAVAVTWPSDFGRTYRVDYCSTLASNDWQTLAAAITGNGTTNTVYDSRQNSAARFYRVVPLDP
jgi:hypothetical protein